jgi:polyhydroxyalkanoate synthesis regulator phasin
MEKQLEQMLYTLLGGALAVKDKIETNSDEFKACQEKNADKARTFIDEMAQRGEDEKDQFREKFKDVLKEVIAEMDLATREDLDRLKKELVK